MTCQPGDLPARLFVPAIIGRGVPMPQQCPPGRRSGRRATLNPVSVLNQASPSTALPDAALALRASACPGLLRIVAARDGGICRIKLPGGELSAAQAAVIADVSERYAAGVVELTNRANLQVRGVRSGHEAALIAALVDAGLGFRHMSIRRSGCFKYAIDDGTAISRLNIDIRCGRCAQCDGEPNCRARSFCTVRHATALRRSARLAANRSAFRGAVAQVRATARRW
jgi:hypothetical protein